MFEREKVKPIPIPDIEPPREIPVEERILRDRKEKQKANLEQQALERKARFDAIEQRQKAMRISGNGNDLKNKKITYDHKGNVIMIKTLTEKK